MSSEHRGHRHRIPRALPEWYGMRPSGRGLGKSHHQAATDDNLKQQAHSRFTVAQACDHEGQSCSRAPERLADLAFAHPFKGYYIPMPASEQVTHGRAWDNCSEVPGFGRSRNNPCVGDFPTWRTGLVHLKGTEGRPWYLRRSWEPRNQGESWLDWA